MSKRIRVLIDQYSLRESYSGIGTYTRELIAALGELESIELLTIPDDEAVDSHRPKRGFLMKLLRHWHFYYWKTFSLPKVLEDLRPDILIIPDFVASKPTGGTRQLVVIHDDLFWKYPQNYNPFWRKWFTTLVERRLDHTTEIITTSMFCKAELSKIFQNEIHTIYQAYNSFSEASMNVMEKYGLGSKKYILHVGTFDKRKDLLTLLKAFKNFKETVSQFDLKCVLVGEQRPNGHQEVLNEMLNFVEENHLGDSVIMPGFLPKAEVGELYRNAYVYVFPSLYEGFGIPILEAFSQNVPVVTSDCEALKEIGGEATLTFARGDDKDLTTRLVHLCDNQSLYDDLMRRGRNRLKNFSRQKFGQDMLRLIEGKL